MSDGISRKERLEGELKAAELKLDAIGRSKDPELMRTQQEIAGQRARVYTLRAELVQIEMAGIRGKDEGSIARRSMLGSEFAALMVRVKDAELSARSASKQASEDELPDLLRRLNEANLMAEEADTLHH